MVLSRKGVLRKGGFRSSGVKGVFIISVTCEENVTMIGWVLCAGNKVVW